MEQFGTILYTIIALVRNGRHRYSAHARSAGRHRLTARLRGDRWLCPGIWQHAYVLSGTLGDRV